MKRLFLAAITIAPFLFAADLEVSEPRRVEQGPVIINARAAFGGNAYFVTWQDGYRSGGAGYLRALRLKPGTLEPVDPRPLQISPPGAAAESPAVAYANGVFLVAWQDFRSGRDHDIRAVLLDAATGLRKGAEIAVRSAAGTQARPAVASDGNVFLVVWQEPAGAGAYGVRGTRLSPAGELLDSAPRVYSESGTSPAAAGSSGRFLVTWATRGGRGGTAAALVDAASGNSIKQLGLINTVCSEGTVIAAGGGDFAVALAREGYPNPWGWPGPGAVLVSRVLADGSTPESRLDYGPRLSNLCARAVPNVVDAATWGKTSRSWDAGAVGWFPGTADGLWPNGWPAATFAWDDLCLFAWVKGIITKDRLTLTDFSVWLRGMDSRTLAPKVEERRITAGAGAEETHPVLVSGPSGEALLVTLALTPRDGRQILARRISR